MDLNQFLQSLISGQGLTLNTLLLVAAGFVAKMILDRTQANKDAAKKDEPVKEPEKKPLVLDPDRPLLNKLGLGGLAPLLNLLGIPKLGGGIKFEGLAEVDPQEQIVQRELYKANLVALIEAIRGCPDQWKVLVEKVEELKKKEGGQ